MSRLTGSELLRLPVRRHGISLGQPVDLILDLTARRVVGLDVLCGDEVHRFLPLAAAVVTDDEVAVESSLILLDDLELAFYRKRGRPLRPLRGRAPVERGGAPLGMLADVVVEGDGVVELVLAGPGRRRVPAGDDVVVGEASRASAA
jgi:hypothetical protein